MTKQMIKSVVDQFDPIGLLEMNCPAEEYDAEVERIFARIRKGMSAKNISDVIHAVFPYKTDYFVSRAMYAPFGAAVNCVPPTDAARAAALIRRLPTYGRVLICRLSAIEPPSGGTRSRGHPAHVRGCATLTTLAAMKNRRHPANHTRHSAEQPKDTNPGEAAQREQRDRPKAGAKRQKKRRRRALALDLCGIPTAPPSRCRAWDGRMRIDPANQARRTAEKERTTRPVAGSVRRHQDAPTQDNQKRERPRTGKPGNRGALFYSVPGIRPPRDIIQTHAVEVRKNRN